jgi:hypothetical protein
MVIQLPEFGCWEVHRQKNGQGSSHEWKRQSARVEHAADNEKQRDDCTKEKRRQESNCYRWARRSIVTRNHLEKDSQHAVVQRRPDDMVSVGVVEEGIEAPEPQRRICNQLGTTQVVTGVGVPHHHTAIFNNTIPEWDRSRSDGYENGDGGQNYRPRRRRP